MSSLRTSRGFRFVEAALLLSVAACGVALFLPVSATAQSASSTP
jgi:hypothetical protein